MSPTPTPRTVSAIEAGEQLRGGAVVAFPTETFYGLAAIPSCAAAVDLLCEMKGRELGAGIPLIASSSAAIEALIDAEEPGVRARREALQQEFWPGPLTIVCSAARAVGEIHQSVFGPDATLAFRISSRCEAHSLAEYAGGVITATSANRRGEPPSEESADVARYFPELCIMAESEAFTPHTLPSTIIDVRSAEFRILRAGAIPAEAVEALFTR